MLIAHPPAGYLCTAFLLDQFSVPPHRRIPFFCAGLLASVVPDLDLLYFYTLDRQQHVHHSYVTHWPSFWLAVMVVGLSVGWVGRRRALAIGSLLVGCNTLLHLVLDSVTGSIRWLEPFANRAGTLVEVPARYEPWFFNFLLYWTFALEIAIVLLAGLVWLRRRQRRSTTPV